MLVTCKFSWLSNLQQIISLSEQKIIQETTRNEKVYRDLLKRLILEGLIKML